MAVTEPGRPSLFDGFNVMADQTGGFAVADTNGFRQAIDRIVRENSMYYLIGYSSTNAEPDGNYRTTVVSVTRPGVQVLYRPGYMASRRN